MTASPALPALHDPSSGPPVQGTLALDFALPSGLPAEPRPRALTLVTGGTEPTGGRRHGSFADRPEAAGAARAAAGAPPPEEWAGPLVQAVVEVIAGDRPPQQLVRWTTQRVYADLSRRVRILGLTTSAASRTRTERCHVRSVRVFQPRPDAAEVAAHVRHGARSRAVAARLEIQRGRWTCTAIQLG